jgi:hypothetical protein
MDKTIKKKWVAALRSGEYKQGKSHLHTRNNRYCCLGVLATVIGKRPSDAKCNNGDEYLRPSVLKKCGLKHLTQVRLGHQNDGGDSFDKIASYISRNL